MSKDPPVIHMPQKNENSKSFRLLCSKDIWVTQIAFIGSENNAA